MRWIDAPNGGWHDFHTRLPTIGDARSVAVGHKPRASTPFRFSFKAAGKNEIFSSRCRVADPARGAGRAAPLSDTIFAGVYNKRQHKTETKKPPSGGMLTSGGRNKRASITAGRRRAGGRRRTRVPRVGASPPPSPRPPRRRVWRLRRRGRGR